MTKKKSPRSPKEEMRRQRAQKGREEARKRREEIEEVERKRRFFSLFTPPSLHIISLVIAFLLACYVFILDVLDMSMVFLYFLPFAGLIFWGMRRKWPPSAPQKKVFISGAERSSQTLWRLRRFHRNPVVIYFLGVALYTILFCSLFLMANCALDGGEARYVEASVVSKAKKKHDSRFTGTSIEYSARYVWDNGKDGKVERTLECALAQYHAIKSGESCVQLEIKPGLFGYEWIAKSKLLP